MAYTVVFSNRARKDITKLDSIAAARIVSKLEQLAFAPGQMPGVKQLKGTLIGISRIKVGDYHILYQRKDEMLVILIVTIGNRKDIY